MTDLMEETLKDLQLKNITIIHGPLEKNDEGTWLYFTNPDENILEYMQWYLVTYCCCNVY